MKAVLASMPETRSFLIVTEGQGGAIRQSSGNLPNVWTIDARYLNVRDVLKYDRLLVTREAIPVIEGLWALRSESDRQPSTWKRPDGRAGLPPQTACRGGLTCQR